MTKLTTLLLDADGVIQRPSAEFLPSLQALCPYPADAQAFIAEVFRVEKPCLAGGERFEDALQSVLDRWQIATPLPTVLALWRQIEPIAEVMQHVAALRAAGVRVCLASNQQSHRAGIMAEHLDYESQFDELFFSCHLGFVKPDVRYFTAVLDALGLPGSAVLFVDDHQHNVDGATAAGIRAERYQHSEGVGAFRAMLDTHQLTA